MAEVSAFPLAGVAYLVATGATRAEAEAALTVIGEKPVPATLTATLDDLDTALIEVRETATSTRPPSV